jgi:hypothetical protein
MDTIEIIHNALEWANKRLELQGEPITENQRNYIVFALRQEFVAERSEQFYCFNEKNKRIDRCNGQCDTCKELKLMK